VAQVVLENVYKTYQVTPSNPHNNSNSTVLKRIGLTINDGEFMVLVGPSGCGKSTLLRLIAGLEELTGGNIHVGDKLVNNLPPKSRDVAMVFQSYALYPHLRVYDNLAFGLRRTESIIAGDKSSSLPPKLENFLVEITRNLPKNLRYRSPREKLIGQRVYKVAEMLQIETLLNRFPKELSGGQKQRVALGRAIARNAKVFLMDEPLSNLDAKLRAQTRSQIVQLQRQLGVTTIYVTHDQTEAMTMGDRIAVMYQGQIQQVDTPLNIYNRPANTFVAQFIGSPPMNLIPVQVRVPLVISNGEFRSTISQEWQELIKAYDGKDLLLGVRAESFTLSNAAPKNLAGVVEVSESLGNETFLSVKLLGMEQEDLRIQVRIPPDKIVAQGDRVWLSINPDKIHLFDPETGLSIAQH
jgi:multiple sugar transport system ATP-binding protein